MVNTSSVVQVWISRAPNSTTPKFVRRSLHSAQEYALLHGYRYSLHTHVHTNTTLLHPSWQRIPYLLDALETSQLAAYFDADVIITNQQLRLDSLFRACGPRTELILISNSDALKCCGCCLHKCPCLINNGILVMRNTPFIKDLLTSMLQSLPCRPFYQVRQWEQDCLQQRLKELRELPEIVARYWGRRVMRSKSERVCVMPRDNVAPWKVSVHAAMTARGTWRGLSTPPLAIHLVDERGWSGSSPNAKLAELHRGLGHIVAVPNASCIGAGAITPTCSINSPPPPSSAGGY